MELKITEEKENELFNRKEIKGVVESKVTPSRQDVAKLLAEKFSVPSENIKIKGITGKFGTRIFDIEANIYSSKEEKDSIELKKKKDMPEKEIKIEKKSGETEKPSPEKPAEEVQQPEKEKEEEPKKEETKENKTESQQNAEEKNKTA